MPLFGFNDGLWPQNTAEEESIGCTSRIALGDWFYNERELWRLGNYGVFHCAIVETRGLTVNDLESGFDAYSWFVSLGRVQSADGELELWVLQSGVAPGSDYTLLASKGDNQPIEELLILQRKCPPNRIRTGPEMDVWSTRYCAINSQEELTNLAAQMVHLPPLGKMRFIGQADETADAAIYSRIEKDVTNGIEQAIQELNRQIQVAEE